MSTKELKQLILLLKELKAKDKEKFQELKAIVNTISKYNLN